MAENLSSYQYTILKTVNQKPLSLEKAVSFNQVMFYSLIRRGYIHLNLDNERFGLSSQGQSVLTRYNNGRVQDMVVRNQTPRRHERVTTKLESGVRRKAQKVTKAISRAA